MITSYEYEYHAEEVRAHGVYCSFSGVNTPPGFAVVARRRMYSLSWASIDAYKLATACLDGVILLVARRCNFGPSTAVAPNLEAHGR